MPVQDDTELTPEECRELTLQMCRGVESAWREFHERFLQFLLAYAGSRGVVGADAYDLVQATYLRVLRHIKCFSVAGELKAWLRCLLRCEQIDQGRKGRRRLVLMEKYAHWQEARGQAPEPCRGRVEELLAGLSDGEQQLVLRSYVEGWTHQELAVEACSTPKAIESKLARLRKRLRENWTHET